MNDEPKHKHRKYWLLCLFAVFIAILGIVLPEQEDIAFEIVKNNTDLCNFNHTSLLCNGIRQSNVTYYTNDTPIVLYVFAHASAAGGVAGVFLYRDDVLIEAQSGRPLAAPEQTWRGVTAIIPKNSSYRVNFTNYHHFEWYEDQILSGKNGTLSVIYNNYTNTTTTGGSGASNLSQLTIDTNKSWNRYNIYNVTIDNQSMGNKVNKTGDNISGKIYINNSIQMTNGTIDINQMRAYVPRDTYFPHTTDYNYSAIIGGYNFINMYASNINLFNLYNGLNLNMSCGTNDGYGGDLGFCWEFPQGQSFRGAMAYQFVNDVFSYYAWDSNINQSKIVYQNETNHTQGYYKRMDFSNDLTIYYGNITVAKNATVSGLAGTGNAYACLDANGKLYRGNPTC